MSLDRYLCAAVTDRRFRPLRRRADSTRRPPFVFIRARNPCVFFRLRFDGWYVRFISFYSLAKP